MCEKPLSEPRFRSGLQQDSIKVIDDALIEPVTIEKHERPVVVGLGVDKSEKLN